MPTPLVKNDHSNYQEPAFRRYEATIATIVQNFPKVVAIQPTTISITTYYSRIRLAMRGFLTHDYESTQVSKAELGKIYPILKSRILNGTVVFGGAEELKNLGGQQTIVPSQQNIQAQIINPTREVDKPTAEVIQAFGLLVAWQYIESVSFTGVTLEEAQELVKHLEIITKEKEGRIYML